MGNDRSDGWVYLGRDLCHVAEVHHGDAVATLIAMMELQREDEKKGLLQKD